MAHSKKDWVTKKRMPSSNTLGCLASSALAHAAEPKLRSKNSASTTRGSARKTSCFAVRNAEKVGGLRGVSKPSNVLDIAEIRFKPQTQLPPHKPQLVSLCRRLLPPHATSLSRLQPQLQSKALAFNPTSACCSARILSLTSVSNRNAELQTVTSNSRASV